MNIIITYGSKTPLYRQLATSIKQAITSGDLAPGDHLPTLEAMSLEVDVSREAVLRCYNLLKEEGCIYSIRGQGYYVCKDAKPIQPEQAALIDDLLVQAISAAQIAGMDAPYLLRRLTALYKNEENQNDQ